MRKVNGSKHTNETTKSRTRRPDIPHPRCHHWNAKHTTPSVSALPSRSGIVTPLPTNAAAFIPAIPNLTSIRPVPNSTRPLTSNPAGFFVLPPPPHKPRHARPPTDSPSPLVKTPPPPPPPTVPAHTHPPCPTSKPRAPPRAPCPSSSASARSSAPPSCSACWPHLLPCVQRGRDGAERAARVRGRHCRDEHRRGAGANAADGVHVLVVSGRLFLLCGVVDGLLFVGDGESFFFFLGAVC